MSQGFIRDGLSTIATGNTLWVDAVFGNDTTGQPERMDLPYLTLGAAKAAASSGDLIWVRPGTFDEKNLLKNGVNWYFDAGASVIYTGATNGSIFDDGPDGANGAVTCAVDGMGTFQWTNDFGAAAADFAVVHIQNASSNVTINGRRIDQLGNNFQFGWTILQENGLLHVQMAEQVNSPNGAYNMGWYGGTGYFRVSEINGNQILWAGTAVGGDWYIECETIQAGALDILISTETLDTVGALWINAKLIKAEAESGIVAGVSGKVYITCQKIWNTHASGAVIGPVNGIILWLNAQKMTAESGAFYKCEAGSGTVYLEVQQYESTLVGPQPNGYGSFYNEGSDLILIGGTMPVTNTGEVQRGIEHVDGRTRAKGVVLDFSGNDQTTSYPVLVSGSGLILDNCTLVAPTGADSIGSPAPNDVVSYGSYANTNVDADVTISGSLTVGAYVE